MLLKPNLFITDVVVSAPDRYGFTVGYNELWFYVKCSRYGFTVDYLKSGYMSNVPDMVLQWTTMSAMGSGCRDVIDPL